MVYLNKVVSINIKSLEKVILEEMNKTIENELYYIDEIDKNKKTKIKNNMLKKIKEEIKRDHFIYTIMDENKCVFKHTRGKQDGFFCHRNITYNGDKNQYLCRVHNKNHIPKKKENKLVINKNISIDKSITLLNIKNKNNIHNDKINISNFYVKLKKNNHNLCTTNYLKQDKKNNFIISRNQNNIIRDYNNNIVCKYKGEWQNVIKYGNCNFNHFNNKIILKDLYNKYDVNIQTPIFSY